MELICSHCNTCDSLPLSSSSLHVTIDLRQEGVAFRYAAERCQVEFSDQQWLLKPRCIAQMCLELHVSHAK